MSIPADVLDVQRAASDPALSAWVAANAGSGKTHVLAQRVIRLLLRGTPPEKILCLTYTKAAAANMANRVFETLAKWTPLSDEELDTDITEIEGRRPDARRRLRARRLFAQALDTPGGLKVQTIHAFCTRLLHQFPFEADVAARFEVLEERTQSELIDRLRMAVLLEAAAEAGERARPRAVDRDHGRGGSDLCGGDRRRDRAGAMRIDRMDRTGGRRRGGDRRAVARARRRAGGDERRASRRTLLLGIADRRNASWQRQSPRSNRDLKGDKEHAARFDSLRLLEGNDRIKAYLSIFCTAESRGARRISSPARSATIIPALFQRFLSEQERVCALIARRRAVETRERTAALITIAAEVIARYRAEKDRRGLLDYDDLIDKTLHLLGEERAAWVHYKLDLGIDHVLIDEAQDTSPRQWEIVEAAHRRVFVAGKGAREVPRSIFAVGDEKQSIFSFQGAEPRQFDQSKRHFAAAFRRRRDAFADVTFLHSFRSAPAGAQRGRHGVRRADRPTRA